MLDILLASIGALAIALGLASDPLRRIPMTEPLAALVLGVVLGPALLGAVDLAELGPVRTLELSARIVLSFSVMGVALRFSLDEIRPCLRGLLVLLVPVLIGMAAVSAGLALWLIPLPLASAFLIGAVLAPTDPVLASSVVAGGPARRDLPKGTRVLLSLESGANDGLAFALVLLASIAVTGGSAATGVLDAVSRFSTSVVLGGAIGWTVGRLVVASERHRDMEHSAFLVLTLSLALFVLGTVERAGGVGVLGVFVAGLAYSSRIEQVDRREEWEVQEAINRYLVLPVFALLGIALPWEVWSQVGWRAVAFAGAVLLLRRLPLVLLGARLLRVPRDEAAFLGWFGPIGVAALLYLCEERARGVLGETEWAIGILVVVASTLVHGLSAAPGRRWFGARRS